MRVEPQSIIVTVTDEMLPHIDQVAEELTAQGVKVDRVLRLTGAISGSYPSNNLSNLESTNGVQSVEEELVAELPPAGSFVR